MKRTAYLSAAFLLVHLLTSCVTTTTTTKFPDGREVTEKVTAPATETIQAVSAAAVAIAAERNVDQHSSK